MKGPNLTFLKLKCDKTLIWELGLCWILSVWLWVFCGGSSFVSCLWVWDFLRGWFWEANAIWGVFGIGRVLGICSSHRNRVSEAPCRGLALMMSCSPPLLLAILTVIYLFPSFSLSGFVWICVWRLNLKPNANGLPDDLLLTFVLYVFLEIWYLYKVFSFNYYLYGCSLLYRIQWNIFMYLVTVRFRDSFLFIFITKFWIWGGCDMFYGWLKYHLTLNSFFFFFFHWWKPRFWSVCIVVIGILSFWSSTKNMNNCGIGLTSLSVF